MARDRVGPRSIGSNGGHNHRIRPLFARGVIALMLGGTVSTLAPQAEGRDKPSGKPRVYNIIVKAAEPVDQLIRERYGRKYDVVEIGKDGTYVEPKLTKQRFPSGVGKGSVNKS